MAAKEGLRAEGETLPPYRICVNYDMQPGGYETLEDAIAAVTALKRPDKYISIRHYGRKVVWGRTPPRIQGEG